MLDDVTYRQYLETQEAYRQRSLEEQERKQTDRSIFASDGIENPELVRAMEEGSRYIEAIREPTMPYREKRYLRSYTDWRH